MTCVSTCFRYSRRQTLPARLADFKELWWIQRVEGSEPSYEYSRNPRAGGKHYGVEQEEHRGCVGTGRLAVRLECGNRKK